jgi:hypothetical protein
MEELKVLAKETLNARKNLYQEEAIELAKKVVSCFHVFPHLERVEITDKGGYFRVNGEPTDIVYHDSVWKYLKDVMSSFEGFTAETHQDEHYRDYMTFSINV